MQKLASTTTSEAPKANHADRIAVVIAAYNEGSALADVIQGLRGLCRWIIVVDDGSTDDTYEVAVNARAHVVRHPLNLGQGAALQTGIDYAVKQGADFIATFDADGQHAAAEIAPMVQELVDSGADIVLGSRFLGRTVNMPRSKAITLWLAIRFSRLTTGLKITDTHNGFRVFTRRTAKLVRIRQNRMAHASEFLDEIAAKKLRFVEFPVTITYTPYSMAKGQRILNSINIVKDQVVGRLAK